jgi:hypothetical protein
MSCFITSDVLESFHILFAQENSVIADTRRIFDELFDTKAHLLLKLCEEGSLEKKTAVRALASWRLVFPESIHSFAASLAHSRTLLELLQDGMFCPGLDGPVALAIQKLGFQSELSVKDFLAT